jgi:hypothetical protein
MGKKVGFIFLLPLLMGAPALAARSVALFDARAALAPLPEDGYISNMDQDIIEPQKELVLMAPPPELRTDKGAQKIFTNSLQKEFRDNYRQRFGFTEAQQALNNPVDVSLYGAPHGYSTEEEQYRASRRDFGDYVMRRTAEYHADNYFKSEPALKKVYQLKERLSKLDVRVNESTKVNTNYSFAGNYVTTTVENPYLNGKLLINMAGTMPGGISDTTTSLYRSLTSTLSGEIYYQSSADMYAAVGRKHIADGVEGSVTVSTAGRDTADHPRGNLFLVGLSFLN